MKLMRMKKAIGKAARVAAVCMMGAGGMCGSAMSQAAAEVSSSGNLNDPDAQGYVVRGNMMLDDGNPRGTIDQMNEALRLFPASSEAERGEFARALAAMSVPGEDAMALLEEFLQKYPASPWRERALLAVADVWYDKGDYALALKAYNRVSDRSLDKSLASARLYRKGYCLLKLADYDIAAPIYEQLSHDKDYAANARFYLGYIAYVKGDYARAAELMRKVPAGGMPGDMAPYYLAQMAFLHGDYKEALSSARSLLTRNDVDGVFMPEANRVAGESLYRLGDESGAIPYLERYVAMEANPQNTALYILGVDCYRTGRYDDAIRYLTPVSEEDSRIGHSSLFYIGQSYLKLDNYNAATLALDRAARMNNAPQVQETAFYNLAVARMQGGKVPFGSSVGMLEEFLQRYPDSKFAPQVADHVVSGYMTDNNYPAALAAIERIPHPGNEVLAAKQKVLYALGTRELQSGDAHAARRHLQEAASMSRHDSAVAAEATLWLAEAQSKLGDYAGAVRNYNSYLRQSDGSKSNHAMARYGLGYARFARKEFADARTDFSRFLQAAPSGTDKHLIADAYNRLADAQYYTSDFAGAAENYGRAYDTDPSAGDYPIYQQGLMKGLRRDHAGKIEILSDMISRFPKSALVPSALLEMAESYGELGSTGRAIETYTTLVSRYPSTSQGRQGQLLLAITYLNDGNRAQAMEHYKKVVTRYPSSDEARVAADDLKQLYADEGRVGDYVAFINGVPDAPKPETAELAELTLQSAQRAIEQNRDADALAHAAEVVNKYPDSPQAVEALAIKADVEFRQGRAEEALASYEALEERASSAADINGARMGVMRVCRDMGENDRVVETADNLLASSSLGAAGKKEVAFTKAAALADIGTADEAVAIWQSLAEDIDDLYGTKSAFNLARYYADNGDDKKAMEAVNRLIEANPPHDYWLARGFILLSDLLRRRGDKFEADEYLKSLRDNYPGEEADIFKMIDERLH